MPDIVSLDEVKLHLNETTTSHDAEIMGFIDGATAAVETHLAIVVSGEVVERFYGLPARQKLLLANYPISEVESVVTSSQGVETGEYLTAEIQVDTVTGQVWLLDGGYLAGDVTVTYTAGRADVLADLRLAVLEDIRGLYQRSQLTSAASVPGFAGEDESFALSPPMTLFPRIKAYASQHRAPSVA